MMITIPSFEKRDGHTYFTLQTSPSSSVSRRYKEFERLNKTLHSKGSSLMKLPGKLFIHGEDALESRRKGLEAAMQQYVGERGMNSTLESFLGLGEEGSEESRIIDESRNGSMDESRMMEAGDVSMDESRMMEAGDASMDESRMMEARGVPGMNESGGAMGSDTRTGMKCSQVNSGESRADVSRMGSASKMNSDSKMNTARTNSSRMNDTLTSGLIDESAMLNVRKEIDNVEPGQFGDGGVQRDVKDDADEYKLWLLQMLTARAAVRAEKRSSMRLARICVVATCTTFAASLMTSKPTSKWGLIGAALGSAVAAVFATLDAQWNGRFEWKRRIGFGLTLHPLSSSDYRDVQLARDILLQRDMRFAAGDQQVGVGEGKIARLSEDTLEEVFVEDVPITLRAIPAGQTNVVVVAAAAAAVEKINDDDEQTRSMLIARLDEMTLEGMHVECLQLIDDHLAKRMVSINHVDIAWRRARSVYYSISFLPSDHVAVLESAIRDLKSCLADSSVKLKNQDAALVHKWIAILSNAAGEKKGTIKDRVESALAFEHHTKMALKLNPEDGTVYFMLGRFCHDVAGLGWIERQAAKAITGNAPPKTTYKEALDHFLNSMRLRPGPAAAFEAAKCYLQLKNQNDALVQLRIASGWIPSGDDVELTPEEEQAKRDAKQMLETMM